MVYVTGFMTNTDAKIVEKDLKRKGHYTYIFTPKTSHGAKGYPYNLWVSKYPLSRLLNPSKQRKTTQKTKKS
jgi:hypothetical protein